MTRLRQAWDRLSLYLPVVLMGLMALGTAREVPMRRHGEIEFVKCTPAGIVMDERVASGSAYAAAFKYFQRLLKDPLPLMTPPACVVAEID